MIPDKGTFSVGETVKLGYMHQSRLSLDPEKTVEVISEGHDLVEVGGREINARAYVASLILTVKTNEKSWGFIWWRKKQNSTCSAT